MDITVRERSGCLAPLFSEIPLGIPFESVALSFCIVLLKSL